MQRKFALLIAGALVALVIPASASATMSPVGHKFEIAGAVGQQPLLGTSLGTCAVTKITGQVPASGSTFEVPAPTIGSCTAGTTITVSGRWNASAGPYLFTLFGVGPEPIILRYASLPGCKLTSTATVLSGVWSNGLASPFLKSGYHAHSARGFTWANDGGTCAVAGKTELVSYGSPNPEIALTTPVTDLTSATTPIIAN